MAYDPELDVKLGESVLSETDYSRLTLTAHRYNGGEFKVQLTREFFNRSAGEWQRKGSLGRLTLAEAQAVAKAALDIHARAACSEEEPPLPEQGDLPL